MTRIKLDRNGLMKPSKPAKPKHSLRPHWRKMTWLVLVFNAWMILWLVTSLNDHPKGACAGLTASQCGTVAFVARGAIGVVLITIWVVGEIILGVLWMVTKGRSCPVCGRGVRRGLTGCRRCGADFARMGNP